MEYSIDEQVLPAKDGFQLLVSIAAEDRSAEDCFGFDECGTDAHAETIRQIESGELLHFTASVEASKAGIILGTDYLGSNTAESLEQWIERDGDGYLPQMIGQAIGEAQNTLKRLNE